MPRKSNTRAAAGAGSIRQRSDGTWEARYVTGHDPGTGKPIRKSVYAQTQREARKRLAQAIAAIDSNDYFEPSKIPLAQWLDIWAAEYMGDKRYSTQKTYKANIETHIKPALGAVRLSQLMPHTIQKFYNGLLASGQKVPRRDKDGKIIKKDGEPVYDTAPMSPKTVRNIHGTLTKTLSTAVSIGYLRTNPADRVTLPRVEKKELAPLTDAQVKDFLQVSAGDSLEIIMKVILFTGMRESEALGLTWDCVDFKAGTVKVCKQLQKRKLEDGGATLAPTKNGKTALVFTTPEGKSISQTSLRYHFKKVVEAIGAPSCRVHDLRHTFAVLSLQNGDDLKTVQENLGHATAAFTLDVYGHVSEKMKEDSAARMEAYIKSL